MDFEDYLQDATDLVDAWEISDEDFPQAVNDQARLMAGMDAESALQAAQIGTHQSRGSRPVG